MVHSFSAGRGASTIYSPGLKIMAGSGELLARFISKEYDKRYSGAIHSVETALRECGFTSNHWTGFALGEIMSYRLPAQSQMLRNNSELKSRAQGIYYDIDNKLAIYYFALDQRLLAEIEKSDPKPFSGLGI